MTNDDMLKDFLNWESPEPKKPEFNDVPASQLEVIPKPRADEKPAPKFVTPDRKEPLSPQHAEVVIPFEDIQVPAVMSPLSPEHRALEQLSEKFKPLFNGTVIEVKDLTPEQLQKKIFAHEERIEMIKVQKYAMQITLEGKLSFATAAEKKALKEAHSEFYVQRREKGAARAKSTQGAEATAKQALNKFEAGIKQLVGLHMDETEIRKVLEKTGAKIPENLTAIISQYQLKGK